MGSSRRLAPVSLASLALATGCFNPDYTPENEWQESATLGEVTDAGTSGVTTSPISTVTSDTSVDPSGDPSTDDSTSGGTSEGSGDSSSSSGGESTGDAIDEPPTIELLVNGKAAPPAVVQASSLLLRAQVTDDHQVTEVEFFVDGKSHAVIEVEPSDMEPSIAVVEAAYPIYDDTFNGTISVHAKVRDDAAHEVTSPAIDVEVELPFGGSKVWQAGSESKFESKAFGVAVDSAGDVIVVGSQAVSLDPNRTRVLIRKYDGVDGTLLWQREVPSQNEGAPAGNNVARGVAVDAFDNVYVVGQVDPGGDNPSLWLGKLTVDGIPVGTHVSADPHSRGHGVAVDDHNRVFIVGYHTKADLKRVGTVAAFDDALKPIWSDSLTDAGGIGTRLYGVAIDHAGDVAVAGALEVAQFQWRGLAALYAPTGSLQWKRAANALTNPKESAHSVAVTADDHYVCVGRRKVADDPRRLWVLELDENGNELTSGVDVLGRCGDVEDDSDDLCGVAVAPSGHYLLAGVALQGKGNDNFLVKKTKPDVTMSVWSAALDGFDNADDRSLAVTVDADGFVIAVGYETHGAVPRWWVNKFNP